MWARENLPVWEGCWQHWLFAGCLGFHKCHWQEADAIFQVDTPFGVRTIRRKLETGMALMAMKKYHQFSTMFKALERIEPP